MTMLSHYAASTPALLIMTGFVAGLFGSLLGLGGGWLMVPALTVLGLPAMTTVGSSLAAMVATTFIAALKYYRRGILPLRLGLAFGLPSAVGVQCGKMLLVWMTERGIANLTVATTYTVLLLVLGLFMLKPKRGGDKRESRLRLPACGWRISYDGQQSVFLYQALLGGFMAGILSGTLGIGGGIVLVPMMTGLFRIPVISAVAISLISVLISASYGATSYALVGATDVDVALYLAVGAISGGYLGASLAPYAAERTLRRLFATLAVIVASSIVARLAHLEKLSWILLFGGAASLGALTLFMLFASRQSAKRKRPGSTPGLG